MRKLCSFLMIFTMLLSGAACSSNTTNKEVPSTEPQENTPSPVPTENPENQEVSAETTEGISKSLVVYFSWSGNTENVANSIQNQTDADIFEIIPQTPYSDDYDTVVDFAQEEQRADARPAISGSIENIAQYDVVYVGFPNWWGDMPMILYTFFDSYDLSGKTIAPFCTSGGSGLSNTVNEIKSLESGAAVTKGLHIGSSSSSNPEHAVKAWLDEIGLAK